MKSTTIAVILLLVGICCCTVHAEIWSSTVDPLVDKSLMDTYIDLGGGNNTFYAGMDPDYLMGDPLDVNGEETAYFNFANMPTLAWWRYDTGPGRRFSKVVVSYARAADDQYYQYPNWGSRVDVQDQNWSYLTPAETWVSSSATGDFRWHKDTYIIDTPVTSIIISMVVDHPENNFHPRVGTVDLTVDYNYIETGTRDTLADEYWMVGGRSENFDLVDSTEITNDPLDMGDTTLSVIRDPQGNPTPVWWRYEAPPGKCFKNITISYTSSCPQWGPPPDGYDTSVRLQNQHWNYLTPATHVNDGADNTYQWNIDTYEFSELVTAVVVSCDYEFGAYWIPRVGTIDFELADYSASYQKLLTKGLQLQTFTRPGSTGWFNCTWWDDSYFTTIFSDNFGQDYGLIGQPGEFQWAGISYNATNWHPGFDQTYYPHLATYQFKDEQDMDIQYYRQEAATWMQNVRGSSELSHALLRTNQLAFGDTDENLREYMELARPDMMMFDYYPWGQTGPGNSPATWYRALMRFRGFGLGGIDGTGDWPIPYGVWIQNYHRGTAGSGEPPIGYRPSESEMRLSVFAPLTMGYTVISGYMYDDVGDGPDALPLLFNGSAGGSTKTVEFGYQAETNRQARTMGPTLIRLLSTDVRIIEGPNSDTNNDIDSWVPAGDPSAPDAYMSAITVQNNGTTNGGLPGDVLIGYFKPLSEDFDGSYTDQRYFLITNALADPNATAAQTQQTITVTFDFGASDITGLQRIDRTTGAVEDVPLIGGNQLEVTLDGGTGDLFKYTTDDSAPFIGKYCGSLGYLEGDLNGDCYVNLLDFATLAVDWPCESDTMDMNALTDDWLECNDSASPCYYMP